MDTLRHRAEFPVLERMLFLNHASEAPVSLPVRQRIIEYLDGATYDPDAVPNPVPPVKSLLSELFGGSPDEYAVMPNTATGIGTVAGGYDWKPGDNVVIPAEEYPANLYPWISLKDQGVEVRVVPLGSDLRVDPERVAQYVDSRTRVVSVSAVEYLSGFRNDLKRLSQLAHSQGALFVVDGIQAAGATPLNVDEDGIDVLAAGGYKWLLGPIGTGFAYFRRSVWDRIRLILPGARSSIQGPEDPLGLFTLHDTAARYETGCMPFALISGWTAGLEMLRDVGLHSVHQHLLTLTDRLIEGLTAKGYTISSPVADQQDRSGIISFTTGTLEGNVQLAKRAADQQVIFAVRGGRCRVSPHFYNTVADINRFLEVLPI